MRYSVAVETRPSIGVETLLSVDVETVDCLKITEDKSSDSRIHASDARLISVTPVSYTHLTLPTIYSV